LFGEDEIAIDTSGQPQTDVDMPEDLAAKVKALENEVAASRDLWQKTNAAMDTIGVLQESLRFEVVSQLGKLATIIKEQDEQISKLRARVEQLESKKQVLQPPSELRLPEDHVWLSDFADQHYVPRNEAQRLYDIHMIHGQPISKSAKGRKYIAIGTKGKRDFWVQLHARPDFRACDDCPHEECGQTV
jgi:hypothetical protein